MSDYRLVRDSLEEALKLARTSQPNEAIARLEHGLKTSRELQDAEAISSLAGYAGLLSFSTGNLAAGQAECSDESLGQMAGFRIQRSTVSDKWGAGQRCAG